MEDVLPKMTMPCLVYVGEADPLFDQVCQFVKLMPNVTFFSLPGLGHGQTFRYRDHSLARVKGFVGEASKAAKLA